MPDYLFAMGSALLWAISAPIVSAGIGDIGDGGARVRVLAGLMVSMTTGILILGSLVLMLGEPLYFSATLALAGLFTFPLATGLYYFAGLAFRGRADFASLFSKVKPLFSFALAAWVLQEPLADASLLSLALVAAGILILLAGSLRGTVDAGGVLLGLGTAALWALGELFMARGVGGVHPVAANLSALLVGAVLFLPFAIAPLRQVASRPGGWRSLMPFAFHGALSFGLAYSLFFVSIDRIGLGHSVLINAFWPLLGILLSAGLRRWQGQVVRLPVSVILAALVLLAGSLTQALVILRAG